ERNVPVRDETYLAIVDGRPYLSTQPAPVDLVERRGFVERIGRITRGERGDLDTPEGPVRYIAVPLAGPDGGTRGGFVIAPLTAHDRARSMPSPAPAGGTRDVFVIAQLTARDRDQTDAHTRASALVAAGILAVATLLAWVLAGRLLRPVRDLTETARTISETD